MLRWTNQWYSYGETGYLTDSSCIHNASFHLVISEPEIKRTVGEPGLFKAISYYHNSNGAKIYKDQSSGSEENDVDWYAQVDTGNGNATVSMGRQSSDQLSRYFIAIAGGRRILSTKQGPTVHINRFHGSSIERELHNNRRA